MTTEATRVAVNSVGWHILEGYPWWPVYVCDQFKLRENLHQLGNGHKSILRRAREFPDDYVVIYYFGSHEFGSVRLDQNALKAWDCSEKPLFLKGHPKHVAKRGNTKDELAEAINETEDYLAQPEDMRLPPCMVPSDLDPTLEPPPPVEPEEMEEGESEAEAEAENDGDDAEEPNDEDDEEEEDEEKEKKHKRKKEKKDKEEKKKESSSKKSKKEVKKSSRGDDKKKKESKKGKKSSASDKSPAKKRRSHSEKESSPRKKAKILTASDAEANSTEATDVKMAEPTDVNATETATPSSSAKTSPIKKESEKPTETAIDEDLSAVLEKEIRWILVNCQFEQMTTKQVRKLLEERLNRDLRKHKAEIKAGVERVIASMEDEEMVEPNEAAAVQTSENEAVEAKSDVKTEDSTEAPVESAPIVETTKEDDVKQDEEHDVKEDVKAETESEDAELKRLQDFSNQLSRATGDDTRVLEVIQALKELPAVSKEDVVKSGLVSSLTEIGRANTSSAVLKELGSVVSSWNAENLVSLPKPVNMDDILSIKKTLVNPEASHEELLSCLNSLEKMSLEITHIKKTGIARAVASLRQHKNDKVSITAKNLRNAWIRLMGKDGPDGQRVKKLENMMRLLEKTVDDEHATEHLEAQLRVLSKLEGMTLSIQEIIDSKIGVIVSKLRKTSDKGIAQAAMRLRRKWKQEAAQEATKSGA